ncbi:uncharacterized protein LOC114411214 [Glycine soja]|uniref:uncharacterized protein n=1 Tax=Glycine max TaxID=3847 RepID=UPI0003DE7ADA|nr:uncharacterized protein LOC102664896 [Glycine max]XP_028230766.1 uncharacterized protein LOC114411214 [Glycine soja]|eukprot:XP_006580758.1 uncharacterized protein LOC102664896 [Glycine max]
MSEEVDMNVENEEDAGGKVEHVDCSYAFNISQLFASRDEVLQWARSVAHDIGFVTVIMRTDTNISVRRRASFLLIACERSGQYRPKKTNLVRTCTGSRKCGCPFKLCVKPVLGGEGWMVKLICGVHNHDMAKSLVGHPYVGRLTKDEKIAVVDMTKSMHRLKDDNVVRDLFWRHPDAVKLTNSCNLVFLIDSTYKTNRYKLSLVDIVGVTPTGMTFSATFTYLEEEHLNIVVWALQRFWGLFMSVDALPRVIVTDRDLSLMNAVKNVFLDATNLLCRFHIDKNMKAKCKTMVAQKNAWDYVMEAWRSLADCPCESSFDEYLKNFEMACSSWPMFVDYVCQTWVIPHKEKFVKAWTNKVITK